MSSLPPPIRSLFPISTILPNAATQVHEACKSSPERELSNKSTPSPFVSHTISSTNESFLELNILCLGVFTKLSQTARFGIINASIYPWGSQPSHPSFILEDTDIATQVTTPKFQRPLGYFLVDHNARIGERYFGPTSLEALMHKMENQVIEPLSETGSENQILSECALLPHHKLDLLIDWDDELIEDGSAPTAPPFSVLEAVIKPYFTTINPYFPIWTQESFTRLATASQESGYPDQDRTYIICSNNVILMTLGANSLRYRPAKEVPSRHIRKPSSMDVDLITSFLTNAKRAIENIVLLLSPRLTCVQTLVSLVVADQEPYP